MNASHEYREWVRKADDDFKSVHRVSKLVVGEATPWGVVCFLAQQAAEKYLKAFLVFRTGDSPRIHDTSGLWDAAVQLDSGLSQIRTDCNLLKPYAVEPRYPSASPDPTEADGRAAIAAAQHIRDEIRKRLPAQTL